MIHSFRPNTGKTFVLDSETSKLNRKLIPSVGLRKTKDFFSVALSEGLEAVSYTHLSTYLG